MELLENAKSKYTELEKLRLRIEHDLESPPKGILCISKSHNSFQYYLSDKDRPAKRYYLNKSKRKIAVSLAQRDYNKKLLEVLKYNLKRVENFIKTYHPQDFTKCYEKLPQARKRIIRPIFISNSEYANLWKMKEYEHKAQKADGIFLTLKNESVRSKSEIIIANMLKAHNVPYHYEYPIKLKSGYILHPDFLCLNMRTRQEFYWEHCGKMTDPEYTSKMVRRLRDFANDGIIAGKNLILTMETETEPLSTKEVKQLIHTFLV